MARNWFGGGVADFAIGLGDSVTVGDRDGQVAVAVGGANITMWNTETGGTQYTDLLDAENNPVTSVNSSDGTDGRALGQIPRFQGPDGVAEVWASADNGPRARLVAAGVTSIDTTLSGTISLNGTLNVDGPVTADDVTVGDGLTRAGVDVTALGWVSVVDHGATGDGSTDDRAAIQAALDACTPGGTVYLPPGVYRISTPLTVPPRVTVQGGHSPHWPQYSKEPSGISSCIKPATGFIGAAMVTMVDQATGSYTETYTAAIRLADLTIDGENVLSGGNPVNGISAVGQVIDVGLHRVCVHDVSGHGIFTDTNASGQPKGWTLDQVSVQSSGLHGYRHNNSGGASFAVTDMTYIGCWAGANAGGGWYFASVISADLLGCRSEFNTGHGFEVYGSSRLRFLDCDTDRNTKDGWHLESRGSGSRSVLLAGCVANRDGANDDVTPAGYAGFNVAGASGSDHNPVVLSGCVVNTNRNDQGSGIYSPDYGLKVAYAPQVSVSGCQLNGTVAAMSDGNSQVAYDSTTRFNATNSGTGAVTLEQANSHRIIGAAGTNRDVEWWTANSGRRWAVRASSTTEAGSNAGTNFNIIRYDDSGSAIDTVLTINRDTGFALWSQPMRVASLSSDPSTSPNSGSLWYRSDTGELRARINAVNSTLRPALRGSATLDYGSIAAGATAELTVAVTSAAVGDPVSVGPPSGFNAGLMVTGYVSASGTVTIRLYNTTGSAIDPASATWTVQVHR